MQWLDPPARVTLLFYLPTDTDRWGQRLASTCGPTCPWHCWGVVVALQKGRQAGMWTFFLSFFLSFGLEEQVNLLQHSLRVWARLFLISFCSLDLTLLPLLPMGPPSLARVILLVYACIAPVCFYTRTTTYLILATTRVPMRSQENRLDSLTTNALACIDLLGLDNS